MNLQHLVIYILAAIVLSTSIIYFILASNEYKSLVEFAAEGLDGEISELQIEIALFAGSGIIYLGLLGWILVKKIKSVVPYSILIILSTVLIITYAASRTGGDHTKDIKTKNKPHSFQISFKSSPNHNFKIYNTFFTLKSRYNDWKKQRDSPQSILCYPL